MFRIFNKLFICFLHLIERLQFFEIIPREKNDYNS